MINLQLLRDSYEDVARLLGKKDPSFPLASLRDLAEKARSAQAVVEQLRSEKNELSKRGPVTEQVRQQSLTLGQKLQEAEVVFAAAEAELEHLWLRCPNLPEEVVPVGNKESNAVVRSWGTVPSFAFPLKNHVELNEQHRWFDMQRAAKMSGAQFVFYQEFGAKVIYALTQLMLRNNAKHGYVPVIPPYLVQPHALYNAGNLPKFAGDFYEITDENLCLIPTAEVSLTNLHADEILDADSLPRRYASWTSCFRREAGGYGSLERGLIRIHQFEKVEIFSITKPEQSVDELERMVACGEELLKSLGLAYQVSLLAGQDCSFSSAKTYDIEVWLPGQNRFYEVSSASNCTDFQARRAKIRYRSTDMKKPALAHTLNASSLALPRLMVALMEQGQQADGSIVLPPLLQQTLDSLW